MLRFVEKLYWGSDHLFLQEMIIKIKIYNILLTPLLISKFLRILKIKKKMNRSQINNSGLLKNNKRQSTLSTKTKNTVQNTLNRHVSQQRQQYISNMKKFFTTIQKSKLKRVVDQICSINSTFQSYVKNLPNQTLTLAQTLDFQQKYRRNSVINRSKNAFNNYAKIDTEAQNILEISSGYKLLYRKFVDYQFIQFQSSVKYLKQVLTREVGKLQSYDQTYVGERLVKLQNPNVSNLFFSGQNQIGFVKNVKNATRMKLASLDQLSKSFAQMI